MIINLNVCYFDPKGKDMNELTSLLVSAMFARHPTPITCEVTLSEAVSEKQLPSIEEAIRNAIAPKCQMAKTTFEWESGGITKLYSTVEISLTLA